MKPFFFVLLLVSACAKPVTIKPLHSEASACQKWDKTIDSATEFLCAIEHAPPHSKLLINSNELMFKLPVIVNKPLSLSAANPTSQPTLSGPIFKFNNLVNIDTILFRSTELHARSASIKNTRIKSNIYVSEGVAFDRVILDGTLEVGGPSFIAKQSIFEKGVRGKSDEIDLSQNRFHSNVSIESTKSSYINNNIFTGEKSTVRFEGDHLFVQNNCRGVDVNWTPSRNASDNYIQKECALRSWCSQDQMTKDREIKIDAFDPTRIKVGDFDGDGRDELIRIEETALHHYDFRKAKWKLLRREKNTPPWALSVADLNGDGKENLIKADGYLLRILSEEGEVWREGPKVEDGFARQYLMIGNVKDTAESEFIKYDKKARAIFTAKNAMTFKGDDWKRETALEPGFKNIELSDLNADGYADLIVHQNKKKKVYNFTTKKWTHSTPTKEDLLSEDADFVFVADTDGDGIAEKFRQCSTPKGKKRIATYNLNHAGVRPVEELAHNIKRIDADFIVLQEVDRNTRRNPYDMVQRLADYSGYTYYEFFRSNTYQDGEYGLMVLSKTPIENVKIEELPAHENKEEWPERNIVLSLESGGDIFVVTHIIARKWRHGQDLSKTQDAQMAALTQFVKREKPDFVLGDFNIKPDSQAYKDFVTRSGYEDSFGSPLLNRDSVTFPDIHGEARRIDYIFSSPDLGLNFRPEIPAWISSDHYPYIVHFD